MTAPATLLLGHSLPGVITGWRILLSPRYHIVGEAATARQMLHAAATLQPAVVLMDAGMAGKRMATIAQRVHACAANARLLICWQYSHQHLVKQIPGLPVSYIAEDASLAEVLTALNQLMRGNTYYCRQSARLLSPPATRNKLPGRYRELLWGLRQGYTATDMVMATGLALSTVNSYVREIYAFIGSRSMIALISFMKKEGML